MPIFIDFVKVSAKNRVPRPSRFHFSPIFRLGENGTIYGPGENVEPKRKGREPDVRKLRTRDSRPKTGRSEPKAGRAQTDPPAVAQAEVPADIALETTGTAVGIDPAGRRAFDYFVECAGSLAQMAHESMNSTAGNRSR